MRNASRKPFSLACILLAASLCQPPVAAAGVYEDLRSAVENDQTSEIAKLLARGALLVEQLDEITRDGLVLAPDTVMAIGRAEARRNRWTMVALWVIAALLAWMVYLMAR